MTDIALTQLTNATNVTDGTGVFDKLMMAVNLHLSDQFERGRITGPEYATVYVGAIQSVISESIKFLLGEQIAGLQADLLTEKIESERKNNEVAGTIDKKSDLIAAQTLGFATDAKQKILKAMLDGYAVNLSISGFANVPETVLDGSIDQLSQEMLLDVGSGVVIQDTVQNPETEVDEEVPAV